MKKQHDKALIIGAGPAGLMCAASASQHGASVLVVDANGGAGRKLSACGGGKANFTNRDVDAGKHYISDNPRFAISALTQFSNHDMLDWMQAHGLAWEERDHGRLFCKQTARAIADALLQDAGRNGVQFRFNCSVDGVEKTDHSFVVRGDGGEYCSESLVIATGGVSYPQLGSSDLGHRIARRFGLEVTVVKPGLVPLLYGEKEQKNYGELTGQSLPVVARIDKHAFDDQLLFTHQGISGPAALQLSSYWSPGKSITIDLLPETSLEQELAAARTEKPKQRISKILNRFFSKRMASCFLGRTGIADKRVSELAKTDAATLSAFIHNWSFVPAAVGGHHVAEATVGGVATSEVSSKTLEAKAVPGLYFIGEVLDITGQLGGYNLQWAWSSGYTAGCALAGTQ